jgi:hypothetical protein
MTLDEMQATAAPSAANDAPRETFSAEWWQNRTAEELRDIIKRGFAGGEAFQGAVAEAERRGREATQRLREAAAIDAERRKKRVRMIAGAVVAALLLLFAIGWLYRG